MHWHSIRTYITDACNLGTVYTRYTELTSTAPHYMQHLRCQGNGSAAQHNCFSFRTINSILRTRIYIGYMYSLTYGYATIEINGEK